MKTEAIIVKGRAGALAHYPHARRAGDFIYLCGTSSRCADNTHMGVTIAEDGAVVRDIREQTRAVIENMRVYLEAAGCGLEHLVDLTTFLVNMDDFAGYNEVYNTYFEAETGPTRTTVAVHQLPHPDLLIEIKGIAYAPPE